MGEYREAKSSAGRTANKIDHLEVKPAENGGHVVTHHYENTGMEYRKPDVHAFGAGPETIHHLMDHLGVKENELIDHLHGESDEKENEKPDASKQDKKEKGAKGSPHKSKKEEDGDD